MQKRHTLPAKTQMRVVLLENIQRENRWQTLTHHIEIPLGGHGSGRAEAGDVVADDGLGVLQPLETGPRPWHKQHKH